MLLDYYSSDEEEGEEDAVDSTKIDKKLKSNSEIFEVQSNSEITDQEG